MHGGSGPVHPGSHGPGPIRPVRLRAHFAADDGGDGFAGALDLGEVGAFDHDAGEGLGAGEADEDAAGAGEFVLDAADLCGDGGDFGERLLFADAHVDEALGVDLEIGGELVEALAGAEGGFEDAEGGKDAVARGGEVGEDDVAGLLAAERCAEAEHFLEDVLIADGGADHADAVAGEGLFEAEIGHDGGDDGVLGKAAGGAEGAGGKEQGAVAIDDLAAAGDEDGAIGIAVEGDAELGVVLDDGGAGGFEVERATAEVDIAAVGGVADGDDFGAEAAEELGREAAGGAVAAIDDQADAIEADGGRAGEVVEVLAGEGIVDGEGLGAGLQATRAEAEDLLLDDVLLLIGELETAVAEDLDAVIAERVVGGGDHHAGEERAGAGEPGDAGGGDDAGVADAGAAGDQAAGDEFGDPAAGFAGVAADQDFG